MTTSFDPIRVPYASTPGIGPLAGQTVNFDLNLTNFDWVAWHQYEWENWVVVDALLSAALFSVDVTGAWRPNTDYVTGNIVINTVDGSVLIADVTHTSSDNIDADITAGYWNPYSINEAFVQTDGDTMTGDLIMQSADPGIQFNDEDSARTWRVSQQGDDFLLLRDDGASLRLTGTDAGITGLDLVPPDDDSVMTLARTNNRYYTKTQQNATDAALNAAINANAGNFANYYTRTEQDTTDSAQNTAIGANASAAAAANTNANTRMRWRGDWVAGTYQANDVVQDGDFLFVANTVTTEKPDNGNNPPDPADWDVLSAGGGSQTTVGDAPPTQPLQGDMWFCTVEPVGLFMWYDDGDTAQWVQTNGAAGDDMLLQTFVQKTGDVMPGSLAVNGTDGVTGAPAGNASWGIGGHGSGVIAITNGGTPAVDTNHVLRYDPADNGLWIGPNSPGDAVLRWGGGGATDTIQHNSIINSFVFTQNGAAVGLIGRDDARLTAINGNTTGAAANVRVTSGGNLQEVTSSGVFKVDREPISDALGIIAALNPLTFRSTHDSDVNLHRLAGFIAEEVAVAFPEAEQDGERNYDVRAIVATLVAAVQTLAERIKTLEGPQT